MGAWNQTLHRDTQTQIAGREILLRCKDIIHHHKSYAVLEQAGRRGILGDFRTCYDPEHLDLMVKAALLWVRGGKR